MTIVHDPEGGRQDRSSLSSQVFTQIDIPHAVGLFSPGAVTVRDPLTPKEIVARLPAKIRVGPFDVRIIIDGSNDAWGLDAYGRFSSAAQTIHILETPASRQRAVDTFIHETNHAIFWAYAIDEKLDNEERIVSIQSTAWVQVYQDNPWLLTWIKEALA